MSSYGHVDVIIARLYVMAPRWRIVRRILVSRPVNIYNPLDHALSHFPVANTLSRTLSPRLLAHGKRERQEQEGKVYSRSVQQRGFW